MFNILHSLLADEDAITSSGKLVHLKYNGSWEYVDRLKARVFRVVDGNTLRICYGDAEESVRLIGIDTPESRNNAKTRRGAKEYGRSIEEIIAMGKLATKYVESVVDPGERVTIEFDVQVRDRYGRMLGYVYLADERMLNEVIARDGYAQAMTIPPNVKYQELFVEAVREARNMDRGLWDY